MLLQNLLAAFLLLGCAHQAYAAEPAAQVGRIELLRDQWGVPHIFAETDAGAMYGLGYATAEDRGFQMHYTLRIIQGRLAEVIGDVSHTRRRDTAVMNDRKMRTFGFARAAQQRVAQLDAESVGLLQAYAHGVNDYFATHRDSLPRIFDQTGLRPEPWTPADCLLSWWHLAQFFATDGTRDLMAYRNQGKGNPRDRVAAAQRGRAGARGGRVPLAPPDVTPVPPDESTAVVQRDNVTDAWLERAGQFLQDHGYRPDGASSEDKQGEGPKFSHAWVADGKYSGSGAAVLVSMPQTPVANPSLLYEFHFQGATFDARGIGVAGSPIILIGWTPHVAWGMTAMGADQADLFRLTTDEDHPDQYQFDGQWREMTTVQEEVKIKDRRPQPLVIRETHLGPVVNEFAFATRDDPLVALKRIPVCDAGYDTIQGSLAMMRAQCPGLHRRARRLAVPHRQRDCRRCRGKHRVFHRRGTSAEIRRRCECRSGPRRLECTIRLADAGPPESRPARDQSEAGLSVQRKPPPRRLVLSHTAGDQHGIDG